ncbi:MAG: bifunctional (p)ppGpp synthetase/guanosine-3',5'-bis(diphosphate) 3'-pyrophosphohydrolase [Rickettsiales bacterium]|jgi:hypothetical protein|nr:bifunctional (p)ppGpp synthetase/guanosine-3',5'-bis(diphosphate) 3'-pyrophosphohydrolase [Rickettsiales bacterium]
MNSIINIATQLTKDDINTTPNTNQIALNFAKNFLSNPLYHECCLIGRIQGRVTLKSTYSKEVIKTLKILNNIISLDPTILSKPKKYRNENILYLCLIYANIKEKTNNITARRAKYCLDILKSINISKLSEELSDKLFAISSPESHKVLDKILTNQQKTHNNLRKAAFEYFYNLTSQNEIKAKVIARIKPIYNIAEKLQSQNALFNQITDFMEVKIVTKKEAECYKVLDLIAKSNSMMNNNIVDYISTPEDGYQSIHATVLFKNHPVDIHLRTKEMHNFAEFGNFDNIKKIS